MKRLLILVALTLACLVATGMVLAEGKPEGHDVDVGNDIIITFVPPTEWRWSETPGQNLMVFNTFATYYITGSVDADDDRNVQLEHSSGVLDEAQMVIAAAEPGGSDGKLAKAAELIMESNPRFDADLLALRKQIVDYVAIVNGWLGL